MPSKTKSHGSKVPRRWQQELAAQARLRKRIAQTEKRFGAAQLEAQAALREGGKGWTTRVGEAELRAQREWDNLRALLIKLYTRKVVV
jgi:hypothetical protein